MKRTVIAALTLFVAIAAIGCGAKKDDKRDKYSATENGLDVGSEWPKEEM